MQKPCKMKQVLQDERQEALRLLFFLEGLTTNGEAFFYGSKIGHYERD